MKTCWIIIAWKTFPPMTLFVLGMLTGTLMPVKVNCQENCPDIKFMLRRFWWTVDMCPRR